MEIPGPYASRGSSFHHSKTFYYFLPEAKQCLSILQDRRASRENDAPGNEDDVDDKPIATKPASRTEHYDSFDEVENHSDGRRDSIQY
jgi:hypothetical protein